MIRIAIAEDNQDELNTLRSFLSRYGREHDLMLQIDVFTDGDEVMDGFRAGYDILFLDIEMPFLTGMDAAEQIRETDKDVTIIFVTNNPHYAIRGYKVAALDYILKPVSYETAAEVMSRALKHRGTRTKKYVSVRVRTGTVKLDVSQIRYIDVLDHYLCYHMTEGDVTTKASMREAVQELSEEHFFQCNKAFLVNLAYVDGIAGNDIIIGSERIPVSRSRKKAFLQAMNQYMAL